MNRDRQEIDWAEALRGVGAPLWIALAVVVAVTAIYWSVTISPFALVGLLTLAVAGALVFLLADKERHEDRR